MYPGGGNVFIITVTNIDKYLVMTWCTMIKLMFGVVGVVTVVGVVGVVYVVAAAGARNYGSSGHR